jgi:hypothetical protein
LPENAYRFIIPEAAFPKAQPSGNFIMKGEKQMNDDCPQQDENPFLCPEEPP